MSPSQPVFTGLDAGKPVSIYWRNLPHWRQQGATYFVTFRLADSIPASILRMWDQERHAWLRAMDVEPEWERRDPKRFAEALAAIPDARVQEFQSRRARKEHIELDRCHGSCVLKDAAISQLLADALRHFDGDRWWVGDMVIMPNHAHLLALPGDDWTLEDILGSVKKYVARRIPKADRRSEGVWQQESYDRIVRDGEELAVYRRYIASNPAKAKLRTGEFIYHRAAWLEPWAPF